MQHCKSMIEINKARLKEPDVSIYTEGLRTGNKMAYETVLARLQNILGGEV